MASLGFITLKPAQSTKPSTTRIMPPKSITRPAALTASSFPISMLYCTSPTIPSTITAMPPSISSRTSASIPKPLRVFADFSS